MPLRNLSPGGAATAFNLRVEPATAGLSIHWTVENGEPYGSNGEGEYFAATPARNATAIMEVTATIAGLPAHCANTISQIPQD